MAGQWKLVVGVAGALAVGCVGGDRATPIGMDCAFQDDCVPGAECNAAGACRCHTGWQGCEDGTYCADLADDPDNCGACGNVCPADSTCIMGACSIETPDDDGIGIAEQAVTEIDPPTYVVGGANSIATSTCEKDWETVGSRVPTNPNSLFFASLGGSVANAAGETAALSSWSDWDHSTNGAYTIPHDSSMTAANGDSWAAYSTTNDLVYAVDIGHPPTGSSCLAVAGAFPDYLWMHYWPAPFTCAVATSTDQPEAVFDDGLRTFYSASTTRIDFFKNCTYVPGYSGCQRTATHSMPLQTDQFAIDVNPCSNDLVVAYRDADTIRLAYYDREGSNVGTATIASGLPWSGKANFGCTYRGQVRRCDLGQQGYCEGSNDDPNLCLFDNVHPAINIITGSGGHCYAAIATDYFAQASNQLWYVKSRFYDVDITVQTSPTVLMSWQSTSSSCSWNQYLSYVVTNSFSTNVGWFWLSDNQGSCSAGWEGAVDTNMGRTNMSSTGKYDGTFPVTAFFSRGLGEYVTGIKGGDTGGYLMPLYPKAVITNDSSCPQCPKNGPSYSLADRVTRILP